MKIQDVHACNVMHLTISQGWLKCQKLGQLCCRKLGHHIAHARECLAALCG